MAKKNGHDQAETTKTEIDAEAETPEHETPKQKAARVTAARDRILELCDQQSQAIRGGIWQQARLLNAFAEIGKLAGKIEG